ncbi:MAG: hypothetical protein Kow00108_10490 [Calditrichia bacterium]
MKRIIGFLLLSVIFLGCSSSKPKPVAKKQEKNVIPAWFMEIKDIKGYFIGAAAEKSTHLDFALKRAIQKSYSEVAKNVEVKLQGFTKLTRQEINNQYQDRLEYAYLLTTQRLFSGIRILRQEVVREGMYYYAFIIAGIPTGEVADNFAESAGKELIENIKNSRTYKEWKNKPDNANLTIGRSARLTKPFTYPAWFLQQKENTSGRIFVGYAKPSYYKENSATEAIKDGVRNQMLFSSNHATGQIINYLRYDENFVERDTYSEEINESALETMVRNISVKDTVYLERMTLVAIGSGALKSKEMKSLNKLPGWIINLPEEKGYHYVVGVSPIYQYEKNSWLEAEKDARKKLALYKMTDLYNKEFYNRSSLVGVSQFDLDVQLKSVEVVARARDDHLFYVLTRIRK